MDTFGNCQRPVFPLGMVSYQHVHKPVKIWAQWIIKVARKMMKEEPCRYKFVCSRIIFVIKCPS